ncbi:MAG: twin-arginine translocase subunit TatB [Gammaproteobacteria bacterium]|nr:twin-arginine translocase subunit TatB [Gammaproteobacteria bacterium]
MFDIGFWELSLISIVALLVVGPERLPAVARTVGKYVGRANRFISNVKDDINKELKDEDLKKILEDQQKLADEYKNAASKMNSSFDAGNESLRSSVSMDDILEIDESDSKASPANSSNSVTSKDSPATEPQGKTEKS